MNRLSISLAKILTLAICLLAAIQNSVSQAQSKPAKVYDAVIDLRPLGYWPVDEGKGRVLHDRSGNNNHGKIYHVPWKRGLLNFSSRYQWLEIPRQQSYASKAFSLGGWLFTNGGDFKREGMQFIGIGSPRTAWREKHHSLRIRSGRAVEIVSDGKKDAIRSVAKSVTISDKKWVHLLYTYVEGTGRLYINGKLARTQTGVAYTPGAKALFVGCDASWWMLHPPGSRSLNGTVRHLVFFDRALKAKNVAILAKLTRPKHLHYSFTEDKKKADNARSLKELINYVQRAGLSRTQRAKSVLELAKMKRKANTAVPILVEMLTTIVKREGAHMPRVENVLRNSLIRALLEINTANREVRKILALALAKPVLETHNLSAARFSVVRALVKSGKYLVALNAFRSAQKGKPRRRFFSFGDPNRDKRSNIHDLSYSTVAEHKGFTYTLGEGKGYRGVKKVSSKELIQSQKEFGVEFPAAKTWRKRRARNISRVTITKADSRGRAQTVNLGGDHFIFDGSDPKLKGWSVAIDGDGYIHIMGGQHNRPDSDLYIPGSWEHMGLSRDKKSGDYPNQMYWISTKPGDISKFEFVGQRNNPRHIPTDYFNYMNFTQDNNDQLYVYGRTNLAGFQSWGLYRYDKKVRRWKSIDGPATDILASAKQEQPKWDRYLIRQIRGYIPNKSSDRAFAWAWQPHFYNYCRSSWGVRFDLTNRMHLRLQIRGLDADAHIIDGTLYAYSDDHGRTFHRTDGSRVSLPLTINPAPEHNASIAANSSDQWWKLWMSILRDVGFRK